MTNVNTSKNLDMPVTANMLNAKKMKNKKKLFSDGVPNDPEHIINAIQSLSEELRIHVNKTDKPEHKGISNLCINADGNVRIRIPFKGNVVIGGHCGKIAQYLVKREFWKQQGINKNDYSSWHCWKNLKLSVETLYILFEDWEERTLDAIADSKFLSEKCSEIRALFVKNNLPVPVEKRTYLIRPGFDFSLESKNIQESIFKTIQAFNLFVENSDKQAIGKLLSAFEYDSNNWDAHLLLGHILSKTEFDFIAPLQFLKSPEILSKTVGCFKRYLKICDGANVDKMESVIAAIEKRLEALYSEEFKILKNVFGNVHISNAGNGRIFEEFLASSIGENLIESIKKAYFFSRRGKRSGQNMVAYLQNNLPTLIFQTIQRTPLWKIRHGNFKKVNAYLTKTIIYAIHDDLFPRTPQN